MNAPELITDFFRETSAGDPWHKHVVVLEQLARDIYAAHFGEEAYPLKTARTVRLSTKRPWWTFGFNKGMAITYDRTIYIPEDWRVLDVVGVLPHEMAHYHQQERWSSVGFLLLYAFVLPFGLAYARFKFELNAETEATRFFATGGMSEDRVYERLCDFGKKLAGKAYGYAWPKPWILKAARKRAALIIRERNG